MQRAGYVLGELAGSGGTGSVYRATGIETGEPVAIKVLAPGIDESRLEREVTLAAGLDHPGLAKVFEVARVDDVVFLVSEWVEGQTLASIVATEAPLAPIRALPIISQLAESLDHAHRFGVVHRDISPDNIMIGREGRVTLIDFGVGRSDDATTVTSDGLMAGTPRYLAPEVIEGVQATAASDQYSLGVVAYEMFTGRWPFPDGGDSIATTMHHHLQSRPVPPSEVNRFLSNSVDASFDRVLAKQPDARFVSAGEFARSLHVDSADGGPVRGSSIFVAGVAALVFAGIGLLAVWSIARSSNVNPTPAVAFLTVVSAWDEQLAATLPCNLLVGSDFAAGAVPESYFDGVADRNAVVDFGGVADSSAMAIGVTNDYGLYGETVMITPGVAYIFSADLSPAATVSSMSIRVSWLDADFAPLDEDAEFEIVPPVAGRYSVTTTAAPDNARFAVVVLGKGSSIGPLVVDELVFAPVLAECADRLLAS